MLVSRALRNQFIIPDWESFTATIRGFYDKVKAMDSVGHVSTVALQTGTERERNRDTVTQPTNQPHLRLLLSRARVVQRRVGFGLV